MKEPKTAGKSTELNINMNKHIMLGVTKMQSSLKELIPSKQVTGQSNQVKITSSYNSRQQILKSFKDQQLEIMNHSLLLKKTSREVVAEIKTHSSNENESENDNGMFLNAHKQYYRKSKFKIISQLATPHKLNPVIHSPNGNGDGQHHLMSKFEEFDY